MSPLWLVWLVLWISSVGGPVVGEREGVSPPATLVHPQTNGAASHALSDHDLRQEDYVAGHPRHHDARHDAPASGVPHSRRCQCKNCIAQKLRIKQERLARSIQAHRLHAQSRLQQIRRAMMQRKHQLRQKGLQRRHQRALPQQRCRQRRLQQQRRRQQIQARQCQRQRRQQRRRQQMQQRRRRQQMQQRRRRQQMQQRRRRQQMQQRQRRLRQKRRRQVFARQRQRQRRQRRRRQQILQQQRRKQRKLQHERRRQQRLEQQVQHERHRQRRLQEQCYRMQKKLLGKVERLKKERNALERKTTKEKRKSENERQMPAESSRQRCLRRIRQQLRQQRRLLCKLQKTSAPPQTSAAEALLSKREQTQKRIQRPADKLRRYRSGPGKQQDSPDQQPQDEWRLPLEKLASCSEAGNASMCVEVFDSRCTEPSCRGAILVP